MVLYVRRNSQLDVSFITAHVAFASTNKKTKIVWIETERFFYPGRMCLMFRCVLGRYVASIVLLVPKPFGGRWQPRGDNEWPLSGVTSCGRVWRKVPGCDGSECVCDRRPSPTQPAWLTHARKTTLAPVPTSLACGFTSFSFSASAFRTTPAPLMGSTPPHFPWHCPTGVKAWHLLGSGSQPPAPSAKTATTGQ